MRSSEIQIYGVYLAQKAGKTFKVAVEGLHPDGGWIVTKVDPRTGVATGRTLRFKSPRPFVRFLKMGWERNPRPHFYKGKDPEKVARKLAKSEMRYFPDDPQYVVHQLMSRARTNRDPVMQKIFMRAASIIIEKHPRISFVQPKENPAKGRPLETFSVAAHDMFQIATRLAGFDRATLFSEIIRLQRGASRKISERTVLNAMEIISNRWARTGSQAQGNPSSSR